VNVKEAISKAKSYIRDGYAEDEVPPNLITLRSISDYGIFIRGKISIYWLS